MSSNGYLYFKNSLLSTVSKATLIDRDLKNYKIRNSFKIKNAYRIDPIDVK